MAQTKIRMTTDAFFDDNVDVNGKKLTNLATPTNNGDAATKAYVDGIADQVNAYQNKGGIDCSASPNYPAASNGHTYYVTVAGKIGGASGISVEVNDLIICNVDGSAAGAQATVGANWTINHAGSPSGAVTSTASSTLDNQITRFDSTTGTVIQNSLATIDDAGSINIPSGQSFKINGSALTQDNIPDGTTNKQYSATEKTKLAGIEASADVTDAQNVGSSVNGSSAKATLVDNDKFAIIDSEASNVLKTSLWSVIKSTLKTWITTTLLVNRETVGGVKNGSNVTFTLANAPVAGTEMLFVNGILRNPGAGNDYTITGSTITMAWAPISTDTILCTYWK